MRTDNCCVAVLVAFALRSKGSFSVRHSSFEAQVLHSRAIGHGTKQAFSFSLAGDARLHVLTVKHAITNLFFFFFLAPFENEKLDNIKKRLNMKAGAYRGPSLIRGGEQEVKDHRAAGRNTG